MTTETTDTPTQPPQQPAEPRLVSPYPGAKYQADGCMRITIDVPTKDVQTIRLVNLGRGFMYIALQNFIKCLANECERNNWNINNANDLEQFVLAKCGLANAGARRDGLDQNDGQRTGGVRQDGASKTHKRAVGKREQTQASDSKQVTE